MRRTPFFEGIFKRYFPGLTFLSRTQREDSTGTAMNHCIADPALQQDFSSPVNRITLADSPQIKHYTITIKANGKVLIIQQNVLHANQAKCMNSFSRSRHAAFATHEAPAMNKGRNGNVKSSCGFPV